MFDRVGFAVGSEKRSQSHHPAAQHRRTDFHPARFQRFLPVSVLMTSETCQQRRSRRRQGPTGIMHRQVCRNHNQQRTRERDPIQVERNRLNRLTRAGAFGEHRHRRVQQRLPIGMTKITLPEDLGMSIVENLLEFVTGVVA